MMKNTEQENYFISFEEGASMTQRYRDSMQPSQIKGGFISKEDLIALLNQNDCNGIRVYFGLNENNGQELVFAAVNDFGNDIIGENKLCIGNMSKCPPNCGASNILNS